MRGPSGYNNKSCSFPSAVDSLPQRLPFVTLFASTLRLLSFIFTMRWSSFATVLGAAMLPGASARALCRPDRSTTTTASSSVQTATTFETLSTNAATIATSIETSATVEITGASDTTIAETQTATATTDITTVISSATEAPSTTQAASTTEASTTVSEAPVITEFIMNGDFEDIVNTDWALNAATIQEHSTKARLGRRYV